MLNETSSELLIFKLFVMNFVVLKNAVYPSFNITSVTDQALAEVDSTCPYNSFGKNLTEVTFLTFVTKPFLQA
jgi:hypothetical protein